MSISLKTKDGPSGVPSSELELRVCGRDGVGVELGVWVRRGDDRGSLLLLLTADIATGTGTGGDKLTGIEGGAGRGTDRGSGTGRRS